MKNKKVDQLLYAHKVDMGGFPVRQPLPTQSIEQHDPFLLLHHARVKIGSGRKQKETGIGPHPHRGFAPVTFVFEGSVHHRDSRGNDKVVEAGGVQWTEVGMGIVHSERPTKELAAKGGYQEIIQLWVNTPSAKKMMEPAYFPVAKKEMPEIISEDSKVKSRLVVGSQAGELGPVQSRTEVMSLMIEFEEGGTETFNIPEGHNSAIYFLNGEFSITGFGLVDEKNLAMLSNSGTEFQVSCKTSGNALLISGKPLNVPLATHGPFVMNNQTQIMEAMRDYQMGKLGVLIEEFDD